MSVVFYRATCPTCGQVANWWQTIPMAGIQSRYNIEGCSCTAPQPRS